MAMTNRPLHQIYLEKLADVDPATYCPSNGYIDPTQPNDDYVIIPKSQYDAFITRWNLPSGNFTLPIYSNTTMVDCIVDWGDGSAKSTITAYNDTDLIHNYSMGGVYDISITGTLPHFRPSQYSTTKNYLIAIIQWGSVNVKKIQFSYYTCLNLLSIPNTPIPIPTEATFEFYNGAFEGCTSLKILPSNMFSNSIPLGGSDFSRTFYGCTGIISNVPDLWNYYNSAYGQYCFRNCTNAANYASIPNEWK